MDQFIKKTFLKKKYLGITEYISKKFNTQKKFAMLIYNNKLISLSDNNTFAIKISN